MDGNLSPHAKCKKTPPPYVESTRWACAFTTNLNHRSSKCHYAHFSRVSERCHDAGELINYRRLERDDMHCALRVVSCQSSAGPLPQPVRRTQNAATSAGSRLAAVRVQASRKRAWQMCSAGVRRALVGVAPTPAVASGHGGFRV